MHKKTVAALIITCIGLSVIHVNIGEGRDNDTSISQGMSTERYILFTPELSKKTYLVNDMGEPVHIWESEYLQGLPVYLLDNGDLIRSSSSKANPVFTAGGFTGHVEKFNWKGELNWEFEYSNEKYCLHHDIEPLPNGNILMVAWEKKNESEVIAAGRKPRNLGTNVLWPDHIIEVKPDNDSYGGNIVWEWHVWDHLIQDYDPTKSNYGNVSQHPELIDINCVTSHGGSRSDWNHINSIDYNNEYDQILLSVDVFNEIWIIDHSTNTHQAAGHTEGKYGKGGDLLYRWGNPEMYRAGGPYDQKLFGQHDARWIEPGCPGEGNILVYNNGVGRPDGTYSSVEEIVTPTDNNGSYYLSGYRYGPENPVWIYIADNPGDFYSSFLSGAQRLPNGNTLICDGPRGVFFEVTPGKETVWEYLNPYPNLLTNYVFKVQCYYLSLFGPDLYCDKNLNWSDVQPGSTIIDNISIQNIGEPGSLLDWEIESWPQWGIWTFTPQQGIDLSPDVGPVALQVQVIAPLEEGQEFTGHVTIVNTENTNDYCTINALLITAHAPKNNPPNLPVNPIPSDMAIDIGLNPLLLVNVSDPDGDALNVTFYDTSDDSVIGVDTSVENGGLATVAWPGLEYDTLYMWYVMASDGINVTQSETWSFTTKEEPDGQINADFYWMPAAEIHLNEVIHFFDTSTTRDEYIISWHWDFGDGTNDTMQYPTHSYGEIGKYDVKLSVVDNNNHSDTKTKKITIINSPPIAIAGPDQIVNTTTVTFNGTGSWDPDGTIITYKWDFGDGTNSTGAVVTHTYANDGTYTVTLNVTDNGGETREDYCNVIVDTIAPKTTIIIEGIMGENDWYISTITTTFVTADATSGINATYYMLNNGPGNIYTLPFNISDEGIYNLTFYSVDNAGNIEDMNICTIKIDTKDPAVDLQKPREKTLYIFDRELIRLPLFTLILGKITLKAQASDAISGIEKAQFLIDDEMRYSDAVQPYEWVYDDRAIFFHGHTILLRVYDAAGHSKETDEFDFWVFNF